MYKAELPDFFDPGVLEDPGYWYSQAHECTLQTSRERGILEPSR